MRTSSADTPPAGLEALHVAGLWAVAVAQPLFDLLSRSPEFFVAHDTRPGDLLGLVLLLCLAGPACGWAVLRLARRLGRRPHALAAGVGVGALAAAVALAAVKQTAGWSTDASFGIAAACGALAGWSYVRSSTARLFATCLSPAALVAPAVFLMQPAIAPLLSSSGDAPAPIAGVAFHDPAPPVVVVVFDQLPLVSLLDREGGIDPRLYPNFAALADDATWFRNASAVSGWTQAALPAIVTGNYPAPGRLPAASDHPDNLFTLLGSHYRLHVLEPLTELCPATLCASHRPGAGAWLAGVLSDLTIVYPLAVLPDGLSAELPPVTQSWRDFAADDTFIGRWNTQRVQDRRTSAADYIASIAPAAGGRPPLHFLHVLLPHEPWIHLPDGRPHTTRPQIVAGVRDRWREDAWAVTLDYQRHLLQVQYTDALLGALLERLRTVGLYDDALIVVTADHGASLRPGLRFRLPTEENFADVAAVPLLIKRPGQQRGRVTAANVETIDVLPTLAAAIGVRPPWETDGGNVLAAGRPRRPSKTMFLNRARDRLHGPGDLGAAIAESVAHKLERFETGDPTRPRLGEYGRLVGTPVADLLSDRLAHFEVVVDDLPALRNIDPHADLVPARIMGGIVLRDPQAAVPPLAVAVNGVVAAVTRVYSFAAFGHALPWEALVDPALLRPGANRVGVFAIRHGPDGAAVLQEGPGITSHRRAVNLIAQRIPALPLIESSGFLPAEATVHGLFRWTTGVARLSVEIDPLSPPSALAVRILTTGPQKRLRIAVDGCPLFEGPVWGRWEEALPLGACALDSPTLDIELRSNTHLGPTRPPRELGVGVAAIELQGGGSAP